MREIDLSKIESRPAKKLSVLSTRSGQAEASRPGEMPAAGPLVQDQVSSYLFHLDFLATVRCCRCPGNHHWPLIPCGPTFAWTLRHVGAPSSLRPLCHMRTACLPASIPFLARVPNWGHSQASDKASRNAMRHRAEIAAYIRILGSYPRHGCLKYIIDSLNLPVPLSQPQIAQTANGRQRQNSTVGLRIGIVGFGNFGQFLAKTFVLANSGE